MMSRRAEVEITYTPKGQESVITARPIAVYTEGFTYTDAATGESDTVSITLCNRDLRWADKWLPKKGDKIEAEIKTYSWGAPDDIQNFLCGKFCCDDLSFSGHALICTIGGVSVPEGQAFRATERTYAWKKITIEEMARRISGNYDMELIYDAPEIYIEDIEQSGVSDCDFLNNVCQNYGLYIKVYYGKLVIYDIDYYESKEPVDNYDINDFLDGWKYNTTLTGTYTGATIKYTNNGKNEELKLTVGTEERMLNINEKVDNLADAQRKAVSKVNQENRTAVTMSASIKANLKIVSGVCIEVSGAYSINGKYFVDKVTHKIEANSAYTMDLEMHKVQELIKDVAEMSVAKT